MSPSNLHDEIVGNSVSESRREQAAALQGYTVIHFFKN